MAALYNEIESFACDWLENLARAGHIPEGKVERRSIVDLRPEDVRDFEQAHFFAGIAGWAYALRLAGWPDDLPVWTASLPCQPWSSAGRKKGADDDRHLWPVFFDLFSALRPPILFGEQVASPDGLKWLDIVHSDLEQAGYSLAVFDLPAAGVGAPHIRQRLYFTAVRRDVEDAARRTPALRDGGASLVALQAHLEGPHDAGRPLGSGAAVDAASGSGYVLAEPYCQRLEGLRLHLRERRSRPAEPEAARGGEADGGLVADSYGSGWREGARAPGQDGEESRDDRIVGDPHVRAEEPLAFLRGRSSAEPERGARPLADAERDGSGARRGPGEVQGREVAGRSAVEPDRRGDDGGGLGDAGRARGRRDAGGVPGPEGEGEGERVDAGRESDEPVYAGTRNPWHPVEWLPCRDGKLRPTQPGLLPLADGVSGRVVAVCSECGLQTVFNESLRYVRYVSDWDQGLCSEEVLLSRVHGGGLYEGAFDARGGQIPSSALLQGGAMRTLWQLGAPASTSQESRRHRQRPREHRDSLRDVPRAGARETSAGVDLRRLWIDVRSEIASQPCQDLFCSLCLRVGSHFCYEEMGGKRVGELRAYGNAIVPELAATFIEAVVDCLVEE